VVNKRVFWGRSIIGMRMEEVKENEGRGEGKG
jgi:hypothetical protein